MNFKTKVLIREYFFSTIGVILTAIGLVSFLIPHNIAAGGASGIAIVLSRVFPVPVGVLMYIINAILFSVSIVFIGKDFGIRTIYCTFILTFFVDFFDRFLKIPKYDGKDIFLAIFFGVVVSAIGMAIAFSQNSSTGGTDILAKILNKYTGMAMGFSLLILDFVIALAAGFAFDQYVGMYSIVAVMFTGLTIDYVMKMLDSNVTLLIISAKEEEIANYIMDKIGRGATYLKGEGAYTAEAKDFLYVALKRREMSEIVRAIKKIDKKAFIIVHETAHIIGEGFKDIHKTY